MSEDDLAAWLRAGITHDRDDAFHRLRLSRMSAAHRSRLIEKLERARAELGVLDELAAAQARRAAEDADYSDWVAGTAPDERPVFDGPHPDLIAGLERAVRLIGSGYQHRPGFLEEWKP